MAAVAACGGPAGPFAGGALTGETVEPPARWASVPEAIQLEVRPSNPYSVNLWSVGIGAHLYVATGAEGSTWSAHVRENPDVRVRVRGKVYELRATAVTDAGERTQAVAAYRAKYAAADDAARGFAPIRKRREAAMNTALDAIEESDGLLFRLQRR